ncbi:MAG: MopE-related protein [bacterium]
MGAEACNGGDDDCDGRVDEAAHACGLCGDVPAEVCDGADQDCDGRTDEAATCPAGQQCSQAPAGPPATPAAAARAPARGRLLRSRELCLPEEVCQATGASTPAPASTAPPAICRAGGVPVPTTAAPSAAPRASAATTASASRIRAAAGRKLDVLPRWRRGVRCADVACALDAACVDGACEPDPRYDVQAPAASAARGPASPTPAFGVECAPPEICSDGVCRQDPCALVTCGFGQHCELDARGEAQCYSDLADPGGGGPAAGRGRRRRGRGRWRCRRGRRGGAGGAGGLPGAGGAGGGDGTADGGVVGDDASTRGGSSADDGCRTTPGRAPLTPRPCSSWARRSGCGAGGPDQEPS